MLIWSIKDFRKLRMKTHQETLNKIQAIATIFSLIAVPIIITILGFVFQSSLSKGSLKEEYVKLSIGILESQNVKNDPDLRAWAVKVLNKNSPVPFSEKLQQKLKEGSILNTPVPTADIQALNQAILKANNIAASDS
jgi:hypothetical protein